MKKLLLMITLSIFLIGMIIPVSAFEEQIPIGTAKTNLDIISKIKLFFKGIGAFTVAGEQRECEEYPRFAAVVSKSELPMTIDCSSHGTEPALINYYSIRSDTGEWQYIAERESPYYLATVSTSEWAYECYFCPEIPTECTEGEKTCATETQERVCVNGNWELNDCPTGQKCGIQGYCTTECEPKWLVGDWGECINDKQIRTIYDAHQCGTDEGKPTYLETERSCEEIVPPPPPPTFDCDEPIEEGFLWWKNMKCATTYTKKEFGIISIDMIKSSACSKTENCISRPDLDDEDYEIVCANAEVAGVPKDRFNILKGGVGVVILGGSPYAEENVCYAKKKGFDPSDIVREIIEFLKTSWWVILIGIFIIYAGKTVLGGFFK